MFSKVSCPPPGGARSGDRRPTGEPSAIGYDDRGQPTGYRLRKTLIGSRHCYQPIEVTLTLDAGRRIVEREIQGGQFATAEDYEAQKDCESS